MACCSWPLLSGRWSLMAISRTAASTVALASSRSQLAFSALVCSQAACRRWLMVSSAILKAASFRCLAFWCASRARFFDSTATRSLASVLVPSSFSASARFVRKPCSSAEVAAFALASRSSRW
jgi:hypothetical protein